MSFNRQTLAIESSACLLQWINTQRNHQGRQTHLFTFNQVIEEGSIYDILSKIDNLVFKEFSTIDYVQKLSVIQKYLERQFGKRMKWAFKQSFGDFSIENHYKQLAGLACYFSIHSKLKNEVINRIFLLPEETQKYLMQYMQSLGENLQNIAEIKDILEQIENVERENEYLKQRLQEMAQTNSSLLQMVKDCEQQRKLMKEEVESLREQKCQIFAYLKINSITEYLDAFLSIKLENERNYDIIKKTQSKLESSSVHIAELEQRIKSDCVVINSLSQQITQLKQVIVSKDQGYYKAAKTKGTKQNKQNMKGHIKQEIKKMQAIPEQQEIVDQKKYQERQNMQLMSRLQDMYSQYSKLNNEISLVKQENISLKKRNQYLQDLIDLVQKAEKQFQNNYQILTKQSFKSHYRQA